MNKITKYVPAHPLFGNSFYRSPFSLAFNDFFSGREHAAFMPAVNVAEDEKAWHIEVSAAGFAKEDFHVNLEKEVLTISAEHKSEQKDQQKNYSHREFRYGSFRRSFSLPAENVNVENIAASYENGILHITVPKREAEKNDETKEIKIS